MNKTLLKLIDKVTTNKKIDVDFIRVEDNENIFISLNMNNKKSFFDISVDKEDKNILWAMVGLNESLDTYKFNGVMDLIKYMKLIYKEYND